MTDDLEQRLRGWPHHAAGADYSVASIHALLTEAADRIALLTRATTEAQAVISQMDFKALHAADTYQHAIFRHALDTLSAALHTGRGET